MANVLVGGGLTLAAVIAIDRFAPRFAAFFLGVERPQSARPSIDAERAA